MEYLKPSNIRGGGGGTQLVGVAPTVQSASFEAVEGFVQDRPQVPEDHAEAQGHRAAGRVRAVVLRRGRRCAGLGLGEHLTRCYRCRSVREGAQGRGGDAAYQGSGEERLGEHGFFVVCKKCSKRVSLQM